MKLLSLLLKRIKPEGKADRIFAAASTMLCSASLAYICIFIEMGPAAAIGVFAASMVTLKLKPERLVYNNAVINHIICLLAGLYSGYTFSHYAESTASRLLLSSALFIAVSGTAELIFGLINQSSANETHPEFFRKGILYFLPLLFTVIIFIPSESYFTNYREFRYTYLDIAPYFFIKTIVFTLLASAALCTLNKKAAAIISRITAGLTLAVYVQYMFLNGDVPQTIGDSVDWDSLKTKAVINAGIWVAVMTLPFAAGFIIKKIKALKENHFASEAFSLAAGFIGAVQLLSLVSLIIMTPQAVAQYKSTILSNEEQFTVSKNKNIITIIIDHADRKYFDDAYERNPEGFACLKDFTYYTNSCMIYDSTFLSIPSMLSGSQTLPEYSVSDWLNETWQEKQCTEFYSRLHENNYTVNFFGEFAEDYTALSDCIDNDHVITKGEAKIDKHKLFTEINKFAAFRYMPLCMKKSFIPNPLLGTLYVDVPFTCIMDDNEYYNSLELKASDSDKNYFIAEHINGTHGYAGTPEYETDLCMKIVDRYLSQLKELGVYDDSVIIITSDHGVHSEPDNFPIFYMKPADTTNDEMQYCDAPIYHSDLLATYLSEAGLMQNSDSDIFGKAIAEIPENELRERLVFQRSTFPYVGKVTLKTKSENNLNGVFYGYYFTGDREALVKREQSSAPDLVLELDQNV